MPCCRTTDLVQRLQAARKEPAPEAALAPAGRVHLPILDDPAHVGKDQVLFELIPARHERRSLPITAGRPFPERDRILPDRTMAVAAAGRPVHRAVIPGMNVGSCRRRGAFETRKRRRPARRATQKNTPTGRAGTSRDMRPAAPPAPRAAAVSGLRSKKRLQSTGDQENIRLVAASDCHPD